MNLFDVQRHGAPPLLHSVTQLSRALRARRQAGVVLVTRGAPDRPLSTPKGCHRAKSHRSRLRACGIHDSPGTTQAPAVLAAPGTPFHEPRAREPRPHRRELVTPSRRRIASAPNHSRYAMDTGPWPWSLPRRSAYGSMGDQYGGTGEPPSPNLHQTRHDRSCNTESVGASPQQPSGQVVGPGTARVGADRQLSRILQERPSTPHSHGHDPDRHPTVARAPQRSKPHYGRLRRIVTGGGTLMERRGRADRRSVDRTGAGWGPA